MIETAISDFVLREARAEDCGLILALIRELAEYEKLSNEVVATEEVLRETLFGAQPRAEVVFGEYRGEVVSYALFFHNFSTFTGRPGIYLEDIYVKPATRGRGYGKCLLTYVAKLAVERNCARMEWSVLDWNEPSIRFYRSLGAAAMDEWTVQRLTGAALDKVAAMFERQEN